MSTYQTFHIPLSNKTITLKEALAQMHAFSNEPADIPFIVRLVENPKLDIPGIRVFNGAVDLYTHDCIHLILGRGILPKDEAFVIGFTMGSTNKVMKFEKFLYHFVTEHLYPKAFRFYKKEHMVLDIAMGLGDVSKCIPLDTVDFKSMQDLSLAAIREKIGIETKLLTDAYTLEQTLFPQAQDSKRLLD